jgi:hypothetical protein
MTMTPLCLRRRLKLLSPLGERLGEGVRQHVRGTPSPSLSPKGERT